MPSVSKIPQNINRYAIKFARKICEEPIENARGINFKLDKVTAESKIFTGDENGISFQWAYKRGSKRILVHNHPTKHDIESELSLKDLLNSVENRIEKIFASTKNGYTSMDMTTVKKSVSEKQMLKWLKKAETNYEKVLKEAFKPSGNFFTRLFKNSRAKTFGELSKALDYLQAYPVEKLKEFAKFSGATYSEVRWGDFRQLNK